MRGPLPCWPDLGGTPVTALSVAPQTSAGVAHSVDSGNDLESVCVCVCACECACVCVCVCVCVCACACARE